MHRETERWIHVKRERTDVKSGKRLGAIMLAAVGSLAFLAAPAEAARGNVLFTNSATGP
ncbi:hypothetical protein GCM10020219_092440 [Nonomuraea dietziae]